MLSCRADFEVLHLFTKAIFAARVIESLINSGAETASEFIQLKVAKDDKIRQLLSDHPAFSQVQNWHALLTVL